MAAQFTLDELRSMVPQVRDGTLAALDTLKPKIDDQAMLARFTETGPIDADYAALADGNEDAVASAVCGVMQQVAILCDAVSQVIGAPIDEDVGS